jgi:cytochrome c oxidase cbb3-type subunit IV
MYKEILRSIGGIDVYPIVSLVIFVTIFAIAIARALRMDAGRVGHLAALPLDESDEAPGRNAAGSEVRR